MSCDFAASSAQDTRHHFHRANKHALKKCLNIGQCLKHLLYEICRGDQGWLTHFFVKIFKLQLCENHLRYFDSDSI